MATKQQADAAAKPVARKIVRGVAVPDAGGSGFTTYHEGREDELEARMTKPQMARLLATGSIVGVWNPRGKGEAPMARSRAAGGGDPRDAELARLREEVARLKGEAAPGASPNASEPQGEAAAATSRPPGQTRNR